MWGLARAVWLFVGAQLAALVHKAPDLDHQSRVNWVASWHWYDRTSAAVLLGPAPEWPVNRLGKVTGTGCVVAKAGIGSFVVADSAQLQCRRQADDCLCIRFPTLGSMALRRSRSRLVHPVLQLLNRKNSPVLLFLCKVLALLGELLAFLGEVIAFLGEVIAPLFLDYLKLQPKAPCLWVIIQTPLPLHDCAETILQVYQAHVGRVWADLLEGDAPDSYLPLHTELHGHQIRANTAFHLLHARRGDDTYHDLVDELVMLLVVPPHKIIGAAPLDPNAGRTPYLHELNVGNIHAPVLRHAKAAYNLLKIGSHVEWHLVQDRLIQPCGG